MSKIILPGIVIGAVALYFVTRKREVEVEPEMSPAAVNHDGAAAALADPQALAE